jgi:prophage regulatory protein
MQKPVTLHDQGEVLESLDAVMRRTASKRSTIYSWIAQGLFPAPVRIGPRRVAWRKQDVDQWIQDAIAGCPWSGGTVGAGAPGQKTAASSDVESSARSPSDVIPSASLKRSRRG